MRRASASVRRIRSIALVHETLSREDGDEVDLGEIVRPLVRMVEEGLTSPDRPVAFDIRGEGGKLPSPAATSLAVVLTELLQNVVDQLERQVLGQLAEMAGGHHPGGNGHGVGDAGGGRLSTQRDLRCRKIVTDLPELPEVPPFTSATRLTSA